MKPFTKHFLKILRSVVLFIALTLLTQVGGIIWFAIRGIGRRFSEKWVIQFAINFAIYLMVTLTVVPILARIGGRVALPILPTEQTPVAPRSIIFVLTNRHYIKSDVREVVFRAARELRKTYPNSVVHYLDAGFPFWDKFAMLPHLSHNGGEAIDLAFCYCSKSDPTKYRASPSLIGYWMYEGPKPNESQPYRSKPSWWRWNFTPIQGLTRGCQLDRKRTRQLIKNLLDDPRTTRILLEAHLHHRWGIVHKKLRFQQLQAARHDDHIHLWVKQR